MIRRVLGTVTDPEIPVVNVIEMGIIADVLPFRWMFAFPTELLMGRITDTGVILRGLGAQLVWIAVGILAFRAFWAAAVRRYSAVSG